MDENDIVIVAAKRTPMGALLGSLSSLTAPELAAETHKAALAQAGLKPNEIDEVFTGCVLPGAIGQAPARQGAIFAGIPDSIGATTINKVCGSGMKSVMLAHDLIRVDPSKIILAGGMESMSNAPYLLTKARAGYRAGHGQLKDHMFLDGLEDAYQKGKLMGEFAEATAAKYQFSREEQDAFAKCSMMRALSAIGSGAFEDEIVPITINTPKASFTVSKDEGPDTAKLDKIARLKPVFKTDGTITAANSSSISDGAASLILMTLANARRRHLKPLARIKAHASHAQAPEWFTTAPIKAIQNVLEKAAWTKQEVDLYEINEAFAVVTMACLKDLQLNPEEVNVHGGACALGHPIGASGARIIVTLLYALKHLGKQKGIASLCIGGGEATAMAIELI